MHAKGKNALYSTKTIKVSSGFSFLTILWLSTKESGVSTIAKSGDEFVRKISERFVSYKSNKT